MSDIAVTAKPLAVRPKMKAFPWGKAFITRKIAA
jgi:hypothetical protein